MTTESKETIKNHVRVAVGTHCVEELGISRDAIESELRGNDIPKKDWAETIRGVVGDKLAEQLSERFIFA